MNLAAPLERWWSRLTHGWKRTNCLFFAVALYFRRRKQIGIGRHYLVLRKSDSGRFPHFLYVEHLPHSGVRFISYKPRHPIERKCPPALFEGRVRWGDW